MADITKDEVLAALSTVLDTKMVSEMAILKGQVVFALAVDPAKGAALEPLRQKAQAVVAELPGVVGATAILTAEKQAPPPLKTVQPQQKNMGGHKISSNPVAPKVKHIVAVASGKGGVGKSTLSANLAAAFAVMGKKTGLMDADIYGSSQPRMYGLQGKPQTNDDNMIVPPVAHGVKVMSMGFFVEDGAPVIWRGPMVHSAIQQLLRDVEWGDLDVLVIDLPPGTGDAHLSLAQYVPVSGAVIVSTPQDVALSEAKKAVAMFEKTNVPVLGMVENMSFMNCENCGHRHDIFDHGKARALAQKLNIDFLAEVPLLTAVRKAADEGQPFVQRQDADRTLARIFLDLAHVVWQKLESLPVRQTQAG